MPTLVAKPVCDCFLEPRGGRLHAGVFAKPVNPPAKLSSWAAVIEPIKAVRFGAKRFIRDCTYSVKILFARSSDKVISQALRTLCNSASLIPSPLEVVASTVTTISDGPSSIDFSDCPTMLSVFCASSLRFSIGPFPIIATDFA